ncbi:phospho-sugar mutase [Lacticaseibacillus absianus]|uniref:phospho-sugar mutase n=1 Tax=Lacticaseibacillus absianus TaxID=2729623 RepID=UPI0015CB2754|nr:phospho-sugar mutase [Lacticaseibacillus absianus]
MNERYQAWLAHPLIDGLDQALAGLSEAAIEEHFEGYPAFGTGGIRALMGVGTNRLNAYTIARVTTGLAQYIQTAGPEAPCVAISFDTRAHSKEFAQISAAILATKGCRVYLSDRPRPTPELSFMTRHFGAFVGIMITASHNPAQYNGYKVYDASGGQITLDQARTITAAIEQVTDELALPVSTGLPEGVHLVGTEIDRAYLACLSAVIQAPDTTRANGHQLKVVYTPLHGTGEALVTAGLKQAGFTALRVVPEQSVQDPNFCTVKLPNPEYHDAFALALALAKQTDADIAIATDPDADRLGIAVKHAGQYRFLSGNQLGAIFTDYLIRMLKQTGRDLTDYRLIKTIVTSDFGQAIAGRHGIPTIETLTGFKFIGEQADHLEATGRLKFLLGYEESFGFLIAPFVRDKDAVQAAVLACEVALDCKREGQTMIDRLTRLEDQYGVYRDRLVSADFQSKAEEARILARVTSLRQAHPRQLAGITVSAYEDYETSQRVTLATGQTTTLTLPKSNVLKVWFEDGSWLAVRPSGTEPKIKSYLATRDPDARTAEARLEALATWVKQTLYA